MNTFISDTQAVSDTNLALFSTVQQGAVNALVTLQNLGANIISYDFQEFNGTTWVDMGSGAVPYTNTLTVGQSASFALVSAYAQVRLMGYASGGSTLGFSLTRLFNRSSGGPVPLVSY